MVLAGIIPTKESLAVRFTTEIFVGVPRRADILQERLMNL